MKPALTVHHKMYIFLKLLLRLICLISGSHWGWRKPQELQHISRLWFSHRLKMLMKKNKDDGEEEQTVRHASISHLWFLDLKHLSVCQDAQIGWLGHHPAILVPGDGRRRHGVGFALQSYRFPSKDVHHHRGVSAAVPDTWRNWGRRTFTIRGTSGSINTQCGRGLTENCEVDVLVRFSCSIHGHAAVLSAIGHFCLQNL